MPVLMIVVFTFTIFLSASLLFLIEPMVGKMMLPLLGGTPAVWNTCMLFFQAVLLAGYAYAHWTTKWLESRAQSKLHLAVLLLPFITISLNAAFFSGMLSPNERIILANSGQPIVALLIVLTLSVGLPMFVVCTSAPLLQRWFASTDHPSAKDPYFLYSASNFGSQLMLLAYPLLIEPNLTLKGQQYTWVAGSVLLSIMIAFCAVLMWRSKPSLELAGVTEEPIAPSGPSHAIKAPDRGVTKTRARKDAPAKSHEIEPQGPAAKPVTLLRVLRWVTLAFIPSSLMLGATTYITTDIAAIPLLWVLPLSLYLITFIIVFAKISPLVQSISTLTSLGALMIVTISYIAPKYIQNETILWVVRLGGVGTLLFSMQLLRIRDSQLIHRVMIMVMPLLVLLLLFMMLSDIRAGIVANIVLHLATLFIICMVCHGELALDRPEAKHLTGFFLWMSIGGVVGGLFNAIFAPLAFNSLAEYPMMMMVACLMLPPLGIGRSGGWARRADLALTAVFLFVGTLLLYMRSRDTDDLPDLDPLWAGPWKGAVVALSAGIVLGGIAAWRGWGSPPPAESDPEEDHWLDRCLDLALPFTLLVLVLGLIWGLPAKGIHERVAGFAKQLNMEPRPFRIILTFGLPAILCYTFVERSVRFGLGVGAIVLAASYSNLIEDPPVYQQRSFFGVLRVEENFTTKDGYRFWYTRLVHGTTLHGKQLRDADLRDTPITYYHKTGPVGQVFRNYNTDAKRPFAVIGLGTGSMACYGRPGQTLDFYDIDPEVVDISFDQSRFFSFVEDAEDRGVDINLIFGDARLTIQPKGLGKRWKPMRKEEGKPAPARKFGEPLADDYKYGILVVDAFSSDAIPVHLITKQAVQIYLERLYDDGILLMHISNRYLDLQPVLANIADDLGIVGYHMSDDDEEGGIAKTRSHWVALARKKEHLEKLLTPVRWQRDDEQLALMAVSLWPSCGSPEMAMTSGLAYAFQTITEQQSRMQAKDEGYEGDLSQVEGDWEPLDSPSWLAQRDEWAKKKLVGVEAALKKLDAPLDKANQQAKDADKGAKELDDQIKKAADDIKQTEIELTANTAADKSRLNKKLAEQEKARFELELKKRRLLEEANAPKGWYNEIEKRLKHQQRRYETMIKNTPEKMKYLRRVGVWTDDFSNILSVFNR